MKPNYLTLLCSSILATGITLTGAMSAQALNLNFGSNSLSSNDLATGASASIDFSFADISTDTVTLTLNLNNTTGDSLFGAGAIESVFTGLALDLPSNVQVTNFSGDSFFDTLLDDVNFTPFSNDSDVGNFDIALADNDNFNGGNANNALPELDTSTVELTLFGTGIEATSVETAFTDGFANGSLDAAVRFQKVNAGARSDKLLFQPPSNSDNQSPTDIPEPRTILSLGLLALGAAVTTKKTK